VTTPPTDIELVERVVSGDHDAFEAIMRQQEDRVFSVCLRIIGDRDRALDATQETFLTVFRKAGQFKGDAALGTWIYRIAVNTCYDQLRKAKRRRTDPIPDHLDPVDPSAESAIESAALRPEIRTALDRLPTDFRAAIVLSDIEGMSMTEVASVLGIPAGTVKSRLFRGRRLLAEHLGAR
jgi:RNA polymerase sigma-70 factor (ECF subfamily)